MKLRKIITMGIAAIMAVSAMSVTALAEETTEEDDDVVYTLTGESENEIVYTQADIDSGHWNVDELGDESPYLYEDFPVKITSNVDQYANMNLGLTYLKIIDESMPANISFTDVITDEVVYQNTFEDSSLTFDNLSMDKYYIITISVGDEEYSKVITTEYQQAEMPSYVTDTDAVYEEGEAPNICIADTENLALSEKVDEDGNVHISSSFPRYESVDADNFSDYCSTLADDKLYRIFTVDNGKKYYGFISTYNWGENLGIFVPSYTLHNIEDLYTPATCSTTITSTIIKNNSIEVEKFGNYYFSVSSSNPYAAIYSYTLTSDYDIDEDGEWYNLSVHASAGFYMEQWYKEAGSSTIKRAYTTSASKGNFEGESMLLKNESGTPLIGEGSTVYYVFYPMSGSSLKGTFFMEYGYYNDDVSGSAYNQYTNGNAANTTGTTYTYKIKDEFDADCFYMDNSYNTGFYEMKITNGNDSKLNVLTYSYNPSLSGFRLTAIDDVTVPAKNNGRTFIEIEPQNTSYKYFYEVSGLSGYDYSNTPYSIAINYYTD